MRKKRPVTKEREHKQTDRESCFWSDRCMGDKTNRQTDGQDRGKGRQKDEQRERVETRYRRKGRQTDRQTDKTERCRQID